MAKEQSEEQKTTGQAESGLKLKEAIRIVNAAIDAYKDRLQKIAGEEERELILLEGETETGYYARLMVDPARVAKILLDYDYPMHRVLNLDAPQGMWKALARMTGINSIFSVDL